MSDDSSDVWEVYERKFGTPAPCPYGWHSDDVAEILQQAIESGVPVDESRFDPPEGADS